MLTRRQRWLLTFVVLAALGLGWYLLTPLFIDRTVNEELPMAEATEAMATAAAAPDDMAEEAMPAEMNAMTVLAQGDFYPIAHEGQGQATVYRLESGERVLRLDPFEVLNGPDLHVWLVPVDPVPDTVGVEIQGYVDLGQLKGNIGSQNYSLPADFELEQGWSVVVWCLPFRVPFSAAPLTLAAP